YQLVVMDDSGQVAAVNFELIRSQLFRINYEFHLI
ncbi:hypothetical protein, partial [Salmonella enterica]